MLGKLLKYEIKATARVFLPLLAVLLVFAGINRLVSSLSQNPRQAPAIISMLLYITILVGILVMTLVVMIQRFYKNLLSDEGYLMFTLPAKTWKHIVSKLLIAMLWTAVSGIAAMISIFIIFDEKIFNVRLMQIITSSIEEFFRIFGTSSGLVILEFLLICIISLASKVLLVYASIALGHLFNRHRILASLGAFIILNTVSLIFIVITGMIPASMNFSADVNSMNDISAFVMQPSFQFFIWYNIIISGLLSTGYFVLTNYILNKRLNLE
ncbi:MAG: hypothetical protein FIA99_03820 [Ruminiclostridium sp.]|nr:hypothetical protein [Ruminiclostridium sp.]